MTAASYLLDLMQRYTSASPVYLSEDEIAAVLQAKRLIKENIGSVPTILELSKSVALNKNKLQKAFQLTEGKSIGEYIRALRMELALELLEKSDMSTGDIAKAVGYHGVSNFYHIFQQRFGETPQAVEYCFKTIRNSAIFIGCFHKLASNANIYMFCDFGRIAPAKMLVEGFPPSPQDRPHSVTAARPADAEKF